MPLTSLLHIFSTDFAEPFPPGADKERYFLIAVEHLTSWPMVRATKTTTADAVAKFVEREMLHPSGLPESIVSDNAVSFTVARLSHFMESHGV